jgi:membrane protein
VGRGAGRRLGRRLQTFVAWATELKPVRVVIHYSESRGPILASGLAFQGLFAVFGGLWVGFSIAGFVIARNLGLRSSLIDVLAQTIPGLISTSGAGGGGTTGIIDPDTLLSAGVFGWTGALALVILLFAALNWLAAARDATRSLFTLPHSETNFLLLKVKDFGLALGFGALLLVSAGLSVVGTLALDTVLQWVGIRDTTLSTFLGRTITLTVMFALDAFALGMLYRVLGGVKIPLAPLRQGALIGALALGVLKVVGGSLLGGASNNPLLTGFAVLLGLLIWLNFACQVILIAAAWIAVGVRDDGLVLDEKVAAERLEQARQLVAASEPQSSRDDRPWYRRMFGRR